MRLPFDQNLSRFLVDQLEDVVPDSAHVTGVGLDAATDRQVWEFARDHRFVIVSKDRDFNALAFLHGAPPKVLWLRVGNASTAIVERVLRDAFDAITAFAESAGDAVLVLP